jgi:hypothetical protein
MGSVAPFVPEVFPFVRPEFQSGAFPIEPRIIRGNFQHGKFRPLYRAALLGHGSECRRISLVQPLAFIQQVDTLRANHDESKVTKLRFGRRPILLIADP